jgi:hypothetical protein
MRFQKTPGNEIFDEDREPAGDYIRIGNGMIYTPGLLEQVIPDSLSDATIPIEEKSEFCCTFL